MNRQLKFRIWDKLAQRFICPEDNGQQHYMLSLNGEFTNLQNGIGGDEFVVQQWTGLRDIQGKEIYEGDICKQYVCCGPAGETTIIAPVRITEFGVSIQAWTFNHRSTQPEVLGNIFENEELLNHE
jgi:hypothetical protein